MMRAWNTGRHGSSGLALTPTQTLALAVTLPLTLTQHSSMTEYVGVLWRDVHVVMCCTHTHSNYHVWGPKGTRSSPASAGRRRPASATVVSYAPSSIRPSLARPHSSPPRRLPSAAAAAASTAALPLSDARLLESLWL